MNSFCNTVFVIVMQIKLVVVVVVVVNKEGKLQAFNVAMLKTILRHFEVPFRAKDRKADLIRLLTEVIQECNC